MDVDVETESSCTTSLTLLAKMSLRDQEAWVRFVRLYGPLVYTWARNAGLQPTDVADLTQEVFQVVDRRLHTFDFVRKPCGAFRSWLWGITRLRILDHFRRRGREVVGTGGPHSEQRFLQISDQISEPTSIDGNTVEDLLISSAVRIVKADSEASTWNAFWRMAVLGHSAQEIETDLGMTAKAVRQAKFRITKKLRLLLFKDVPEFGRVEEQSAVV